MRCSCPDWALLCTHLMAVIYLVIREIDGNRFMVFLSKGVDLIKALKDRHICIEREAEATLPTVGVLLLTASHDTDTDTDTDMTMPQPPVPLTYDNRRRPITGYSTIRLCPILPQC